MVHGVIIVRKEKGMTSFGVVSRMRRIFDQKKIGHTGTLDPDAEGVLPVCLGKATRLVEQLSHGTKTYRAVLLLGTVTDTQDVSGKILETREVNVTEEEVRSVLMGFTGKQMQLPPMYSALKVGGRKLVDLAREGREVERKEREVEFSGIEIHRIELPRVEFSVTCSHGAYIRTLCHDAGRRLGCGACMETLLRTRVEEFTLDQAMTLSEISAAKEAEDAAGENPSAYSFVLPPDRFYRDLPAAVIDPSFEQALLNGRPAPCRKAAGEGISGLPDGARIRMYLKNGDFVGIYRKEDGFFRLETFFCEIR